MNWHIRRVDAPRLTGRGLSQTAAAVAALLTGASLQLVAPVPAAGAVYAAALVKDVAAGDTYSDPAELTPVGSVVFFSAFDATSGRELWKTDGTEAGTEMVKDINTGATDSDPLDLVAAGGTLYFFANNGTNGYELWSSDGTAAGTMLVKDINPGAATSAGPNTDADMVGASGTTVFFRADDGTHGFELWKSDGSANGTVLVKDIAPGLAASHPIHKTYNGAGTLFFSADAGTGRVLWKSDGTTSGTVAVNGSNNYPNSPEYLVRVGTTVYFNAGDPSVYQLWRSDGTTAGTTVVKDTSGPIDPFDLFAAGSTLYFFASDETNGYELWKSDGTAAGTVLVKDINPGINNSADIYSSPGLAVEAGTVFFNANDGTHGFELWKSDGTAAGTTLVKDINPDAGSSAPYDITSVEGTLFFAATDPAYGQELWSSDGTETGTALVADIYDGTEGSGPDYLTSINGLLLFTATDVAHGDELWKVQVFINANSPGAPTLAQVAFGRHPKNIPIGSGAKSPLTLQGLVTDSDFGDLIRLEVEVKAIGTAFNGSDTTVSASVASGQTAGVSLDLPKGSYHWRARALDRGAQASDWTAFGSNSEGSADFKIRR